MPIDGARELTPIEKARSLRDPVLYQQNILCRRLWAKQKEIVRSVEQYPLTAVAGSHASGKTMVSSGMPLYWLQRYPEMPGEPGSGGRVFTTSPTGRQVKAFWRDVASARLGSRIAKQLLPEPNQTGLTISPDRFAMGASSSGAVNLQGFHGHHVLVICDEAPGIAGDIWDAIEGIRAGGHVRMLELGNPVIPSGHFYDSFTKNRNIYNCISISAFDTPNLQHPNGTPITEDQLAAMSPEELAYKPYQGLISREWVRERMKTWGRKHPKYMSRVLGQFPSDDPLSCFPLSWIERARRDPTEQEVRDAIRIGRLQVGIDVAGAGSDETVLTARIGGIIVEQHFWSDADPRGPVSRVLARLAKGVYEWQQTARDPEAPEWFARLAPVPLSVVVVDTVSIGYNFGFHLADQGFPVFGFNAGERPMDASMFVNKKAEAYWYFRTHGLESNAVSGLADEETAAQLSTIRQKETSRGLTEIESKEDRNKRGIPGSPDRAESLILAFYYVRPAVRQLPLVPPGGYHISSI